jgi:hypothetical protein
MFPNRRARVLMRMDKRRQIVAELLLAQKQEVLIFRGSPDSWSPIDVVEHLVLSEFFVRRSLSRAARQAVSGPPLSMRQRLNGTLLYVALQSPLRFKVPEAARGVSPSGRTELPPLLEKWDHTRAAIGDTVSTMSPEQLAHPVFTHPLAGAVGIDAALGFVDAHLLHHYRQIQRILRSAARAGQSGRHPSVQT